MLQRLEKLICLVRSFSMSCDIFDLHICQDRWKLENWCLLLTQVDCRALWPHAIRRVDNVLQFRNLLIHFTITNIFAYQTWTLSNIGNHRLHVGAGPRTPSKCADRNKNWVLLHGKCWPINYHITVCSQHSAPAQQY